MKTLLFLAISTLLLAHPALALTLEEGVFVSNDGKCQVEIERADNLHASDYVISIRTPRQNLAISVQKSDLVQKGAVITAQRHVANETQYLTMHLNLTGNLLLSAGLFNNLDGIRGLILSNNPRVECSDMRVDNDPRPHQIVRRDRPTEQAAQPIGAFR